MPSKAFTPFSTTYTERTLAMGCPAKSLKPSVRSKKFSPRCWPITAWRSTMGNARIGAAKIAVIEKIVDKAVDAWTWHLGEDVNPDLLDSEVLSGAYDAVFEAIRTDLDEFAGRQGEVGWAQESLRSPLVPEIWQRISDRGIFYDYDYDQLQQCFVGEVRTATKRDIMGRLLRKGTFIYREWIRWNKEHTEKRTKTRKKKQTLQTRWNQEVVDRFNELALVAMERPEGTLKEQIAQRLVGLQWFVGRRAWIELGVQADFALSDGPAWADGWLTFSGHAKKTAKEKDGIEPEKIWDIPIFGIDPERFLEAFDEFRTIKSSPALVRPRPSKTERDGQGGAQLLGSKGSEPWFRR